LGFFLGLKTPKTTPNNLIGPKCLKFKLRH
jgi:hypothetical protein